MKMGTINVIALVLLAGCHTVNGWSEDMMTGYIPKDFKVTHNERFDANAYCNWCLTTRQSTNYFKNPNDHSTYYQCFWSGSKKDVAQATIKSCSTCTFWDQESLGCVTYPVAKAKADAASNTVPFKTKIRYGFMCRKYYECRAVIGFDIKCCEEEGYAFNATSQSCELDSVCMEPCVYVPTEKTTTPKNPVLEKPVGGTCWFRGWEFNEDEDKRCYWLLSGGRRYQRLCCPMKKQVFDLVTCECSKDTPKPVCLKVSIGFNGEGIKDDTNLNYVDSGTVTIFNGAFGNFDGEEDSNLEIPRFNSYQYGNSMGISVWFLSKVPDSELFAGIVSNGVCGAHQLFGVVDVTAHNKRVGYVGRQVVTDEGSVNIWAKGGAVYGGIQTKGNGATVMATSTMISGVAEMGKWNHAVLTYNGREVFFYVNNELVGSMFMSGDIRTTKAAMSIGRNFCKDVDEFCSFTGLIENFQYYQCFLSKGDVNKLYTDQLPDNQDEEDAY